MATEQVEEMKEDSNPEVDQAGMKEDWELGLDGMTMILNNDWDQAQALFNTHKDTYPLMHAGNSLVMFMQALMTFEEEKLSEAMKALKETEKKCEKADGFKSEFKKKSKKKIEQSVEDRLQRQTIIADAILYQAVLTFINQDLSSYIKGGWLLRKAWKVYEKTYKEAKHLYEVCHGGTPNSTPAKNIKKSASSPASLDSASISSVGQETVSRLLGAVSFGYGTFQLCISLVPPKLLKIIELIGFEGDRDTGLKCLDFASHTRDMRAPMAMLGLLWYHTVIRPFFALDGGNVDAGTEEATALIERCQKEYPHSALFLFFKGRVERLKSELDASLSTYNQALESCGNQREIQLICFHEIGWCHMMKLQWASALECFDRLKRDSRWSKSYYSYLSGVCQGAAGDVKGAEQHFSDVPGLVKRKNNQIEAFALQRAERFKKNKPSQEYCTLLGLEVLYLWNALPTCSKDTIQKMLEECAKQMDKKVFHLQSLIEGTLFIQAGDEEMAMQCFKEAIARHHGMKEDAHVAAFSHYELGVLMSGMPGQSEIGKKHLMDAKDNYKDYDFENRLNVRIHAALRRIKAEGTPL